jgi:N-methylhydantoinase A
MNDRRYRVGVDIGGTHTDFLVLDSEENLDTHKTSTTPGQFANGVVTGLAEIAESYDYSLDEFLSSTDRIVHGTTVTTNAVLEGDEAQTGLLTTDGFRDVMELNMSRDDDIYNLRSEHKSRGPFLERYLRRTLSERVDRQGEITTSVDSAEVTAKVDQLVEEGVETIAIALMNSYTNEENERRIAEIVSQRDDIEAYSVSTDLTSKLGLFDRSLLTTVDASLKPVLRDYVAELVSQLESNGFNGVFLIMKANGGVSKPEILNTKPVLSLNSGPAAAVVGNATNADRAGFQNLISMDMGGTSTDVCLIQDGTPPVTTDNTVGDTPVPTSMVDIDTIGAGGGSIAWIDDRDVLQIGPKSAGAEPGPICYGRGGTRPTVTDANLILGYLNPDSFLGGEMSLDEKKAREGIEKNVASPLGLSVADACAGIYQLTNEQIVSQIRQVSIKRGHDPRDFVLVSVGGAGPVHAGAIAEEFDTSVLVPEAAGTLSAYGLLQSDVKHNFVQSVSSRAITDETISDISEIYQELKEEAAETLASEEIPEDRWRFERQMSTRYHGQVHHVDIKLPNENLRAKEIRQRHHEQHERLYTFQDKDSDIEVVNLQLTAIAQTQKPSLSADDGGVKPEDAIKHHRDAYFDGKFTQTAVYDGDTRIRGSFTGPAVVEFSHTTVVVPPKFDVTVDRWGNYVMTPQ